MRAAAAASLRVSALAGTSRSVALGLCCRSCVRNGLVDRNTCNAPATLRWARNFSATRAANWLTDSVRTARLVTGSPKVREHMGFAGFGWGALSDRYGPRRVVLAGVVLLGLASILASRSSSLLQFQLCFGLLIGVAAGAFFAPVIAATAASFDKHRNLAVSLVSAGIGVAPMTIAPFAGWLVSQHGWRTAQMVIGLGAWAVLLPAVWFIRRTPVPASAAGTAASAEPEMSARSALRSRAFIVLGAAYFACCAAHSGPIFHTVSYAIGCGLPVVTAVTIYSMADQELESHVRAFVPEGEAITMQHYIAER